MLPTLKTRNRYPERAEAIAKKLRNYTHESFLQCFYEHFQVYRSEDNKITMNFPWCCFLALKWKFCMPQKINATEMSRRDFENIVNRTYQLQDEAADLFRNEGIFLEMRRMVINQSFYQTSLRTFVMNIVRQYCWYCCNDSPFFKDNFFRITGLRLDSYYKMAFFLLAFFNIKKDSESGVLKLNQLIIYMVPVFGVDEVDSFMRLVALRPHDAEIFCKQHHREDWKAEEYYERTPFVFRPLFLTENEVVALSKHVLGAGLSTLVPELFSKRLSGVYGDKFGKTVERYLENYIRHTFTGLRSEKELILLYKRAGHTGKVVDYLIDEGEARVFIDSKAVMPHRHLRESADARMLNKKIQANLIEGLEKGEKCASIINKIEKRSPCERDSLIIILYQDHFISNGAFIASNIQPDVFDNLRQELQHLPIPANRVYYLTIDEFEMLIDICRLKHLTITEIIDRISDSDRIPMTQKLNFEMHLLEFLPEEYPVRKDVSDVYDTLLYEFKECMNQTSKIWDGKLDEFMRIKRRLQLKK
ncbi:GapS1 family protein [Pantoea agglomerans]|uniref:GapS1 family protein n=1 Tax=Enterobacter agglomerans TaxID=549 RepID=UPI003D1CEC55